MNNIPPIHHNIQECPDTCPVCNEPFISTCRCFASHRECKNGHKWHHEGRVRKELGDDGRVYTRETWWERVVD